MTELQPHAPLSEADIGRIFDVIRGWNFSPQLLKDDDLAALRTLALIALRSDIAAKMPPEGYTLVATDLFQEITKHITPDQMKAICTNEGLRAFGLPTIPAVPCVADALDAARYRWINKKHNFVMHIEDNDFRRQHMNLRCGEPLDTWIDARIAEERTPERSKP